MLRLLSRLFFKCSAVMCKLMLKYIFLQATKAYMAGSKALAKDLGAKGREQSELMKAAHVSASQAIYKHRNPISGESFNLSVTRL